MRYGKAPAPKEGQCLDIEAVRGRILLVCPRCGSVCTVKRKVSWEKTAKLAIYVAAGALIYIGLCSATSALLRFIWNR